MLKQYANSPWKYRDFNIEDLKEQFGIDKDKYGRYNDFKRVVVDIAIKHINKETDIIVNYTEKKSGRKVAVLRFHVKSKLTQLEQAEIFFTEFMDDLPDIKGNPIKSLWDNEKNNKQRFIRFKKAFDKWLELSCHNYIEVSTDLLEVDTEASLLYDKNHVIAEVSKAYFGK